MAFSIRAQLSNLFQQIFSSPVPELLDALPTHLRNSYASDFHLADEAFYAGRLETTSRGRKKYWDHWQAYAKPLGVDPYLQDTPFTKRIRLLSGLVVRVRSGYYGNGNQVKIAQSVAQLRPLARRSRWPVMQIQQR